VAGIEPAAYKFSSHRAVYRILQGITALILHGIS